MAFRKTGAPESKVKVVDVEKDDEKSEKDVDERVEDDVGKEEDATGEER